MYPWVLFLILNSLLSYKLKAVFKCLPRAQIKFYQSSLIHICISTRIVPGAKMNFNQRKIFTLVWTIPHRCSLSLLTTPNTEIVQFLRSSTLASFSKVKTLKISRITIFIFFSDFQQVFFNNKCQVK